MQENLQKAEIQEMLADPQIGAGAVRAKQPVGHAASTGLFQNVSCCRIRCLSDTFADTTSGSALPQLLLTVPT
jgi:hypothetical protein